MTEHKNILSILWEEKGIPQLAASRLQRWTTILSGSNYTLKYKTEISISNADCLSQLRLWKWLFEIRKFIVFTDLVESPLTSLDVKNEPAKNPVVSIVIHHVQFGWSMELKLWAWPLALIKLVKWK